MKFWDDVGDPS